MMKVFYKPTKQVLLVPDEEALSIMKNDRANNYQIIGAGFREDAEVTEQDVVDAQTKKKTKEKEELEPSERPLEDFSVLELRVLCKKLGLPASRSNKTACIKMIRDYQNKEEE